MDYQAKAQEFFGNQKSIGAAVENFIDQFSELYANEDKKEQEILAQCIQQMFRQYYYSLLVPDQVLTPANIVNTLCEREFGRAFMAVPNLCVTLKGKKINKIDYRITYFEANKHPMIQDLEAFLKTAATGIGMEIPGIPLAKERGKLKGRLFLDDRHYINIIGLVALTAGFIECRESENGIIGKATSKATDFLSWEAPRKLQNVIENAVKLCSNSLTASFPEFRKEFTAPNIMSLLCKVKDLDRAMRPVFKKLGLDPQLFDPTLQIEEFEEIFQLNPAELENVAKAHWLLTLLDMYFFTPFGYYLQLIQPVYPELYDPAMEMDILLADVDDFQEVRTKLFKAASEFDLTVLGEDLLTEGDKPGRGQTIPAEVGDEEMYRVVISNTEYLDLDDFDEFEDNEEEDDCFEEEEVEEEPFQLQLENLFETPPAGPKKKGQLIDFQAKKNESSKKKALLKEDAKAAPSLKAVAKSPPDDQVFVFKVKLSHAKRIWRQIEIKGTQSLHDLHEAILGSFGLEPGHLYSFFMSNKFWDNKTEYSHPQAEGRSARKIKISGLDLSLKQKFAYLHDYGDENRFEVELTLMRQIDKGAGYPRETNRNKPSVTVCGQCLSDQNPIEWYCMDHDTYLCNACAESEEHDECFIDNAIV